jgi:hypothetical protein
MTMQATQFKHVTSQGNAGKVWDWLQNRDGILVWKSASLSDPSASCTTPFRDQEGKQIESAGWKYDKNPEHITSADEVGVDIVRVLEEVPIKVRMGSQGMSLKITDASKRKMDRLRDKHQKGQAGEVWWTPSGDFLFPSCLICVSDRQVPISQFINDHENQ